LKSAYSLLRASSLGSLGSLGCCLLSGGTHTRILCEKYRLFNFKSGGTYKNHCALKCTPYPRAHTIQTTQNLWPKYQQSYANTHIYTHTHTNAHTAIEGSLSQAASTLVATAGTTVCTAAGFVRQQEKERSYITKDYPNVLNA